MIYYKKKKKKKERKRKGLIYAFQVNFKKQIRTIQQESTIFKIMQISNHLNITFYFILAVELLIMLIKFNFFDLMGSFIMNLIS